MDSGEVEFPEQLRRKMDEYAHLVYEFTKSFPREELYGVTSQLRRASLSVILNFVEGFARRKSAVKKNFWEISYGSLKESKYLIEFSHKENYLEKKSYQRATAMADEIGAMLWRMIDAVNSSYE